MLSFPENCIKGIPNETFVIPDSLQVAPHLFQFQEDRVRGDNWIEESINWMDDDHVIEFTMNQTKKDGSIHFRYGVAILPLNKIEELRNRPGFQDLLSYERHEKQDNPYHGNVLIRRGLHKHQKVLICAGLALGSKIQARDEN